MHPLRKPLLLFENLETLQERFFQVSHFLCWFAAHLLPRTFHRFSKNDGKFLVRGGQQTNKENAKLERTVLVEFPSFQIAEEVYAGDAYQAALKHIKNCSLRDFVITEGI